MIQSFRALGVFLILATTSVLQAQEQRGLRLEDYFRLEGAGSAAISPDGSQVAFLRTRILKEEERTQSEIWIVPTDGSEPARRITSPSHSASSPRWSHDGRLLAFSSSRPIPGEGRSGWWFLRMDGTPGEAFRIPGVLSAPLFSPDGEWVALTLPTPPFSADGRPPHPVETSEATEFETEIQAHFDGRVFDWMNYRFD